MAPGLTANGVAICCCPMNAGSGAVGACCSQGRLGDGNCGPKSLG